MRSSFVFILGITLLCACSSVRFVKPLNKKQHAVNVSLGGELIKYSTTTIPIPFLTLNYGYGIDSALTGFAAVNVTSALFGNIQADVGITKQVIRQRRYIPSVSISPVCTFIYRNRHAARLFPQVGVYTVWEYGRKKNYFYTGLDNWFEFATKKAYNKNQVNHWIIMPLAGHSFTRKHWSINTEVRVIAPNISNEKLVVEYQTPLKNKGAFGVYVSVTRKF